VTPAGCGASRVPLPGFTTYGCAATANRTKEQLDRSSVVKASAAGVPPQIELTMSYPMSAARNFDEVLRALDAVQLNARHTVATPVNWRPGEDVIIPPTVSDEAAKAKYPGGWKTLQPYLRVVPQPE